MKKVKKRPLTITGLLQIVKNAGYTGYIGIEYEGQRLTAEEGIMATKKLLIEEGSKLNMVIYFLKKSFHTTY